MPVASASAAAAAPTHLPHRPRPRPRPRRVQVRSAILTAAQCATYDEVKRRVIAVTGWKDSIQTHLLSSMIAGLVTTTITNPIDVIKTRMFVGECRVQTRGGGYPPEPCSAPPGHPAVPSSSATRLCCPQACLRAPVNERCTPRQPSAALASDLMLAPYPSG